MLISEIINPNLRTKPRTKATHKNKAPIKGPYAPPPKPLPKPKPLKLTPLQIKQKRLSNLQAYAKAVQSNLKNTHPYSSAKQIPAQHLNTLDNLNPNRDDHEKEAFLKQLHGEIS